MERKEREQLTLGILLNDDPRFIEAIENCYIRLKPKYFSIQEHGQIYDVIRSLHEKGKPVNVYPIAATLKSLPAFQHDNEIEKYLNALKDNALFYADNLEMFCNEIYGTYLKDNIKSLGEAEKPANELVKRIDELLNEYAQTNNSINDINAFTLDYLKEDFDKSLKKYAETTIISTGFNTLDEKLGTLGAKGGLLPERLYILGAIPSLGKTTFTQQIADNIAASGTPVLFFSMEQSRFELVTKSIAREMYKLHENKQSKVMKSAGMILKTGLKSEDDQAALNAYKKAAENLYIYEGNFNTTPDTITATVRRFKREHRQKPVVIVDYLQILKPTEQTRAAKTKDIIDDIVNSLKVLARNEEIPVIAISSFNRGSYAKQATFDAFKESGSIEYSADTVMALQLQKLNELDTETTDRKAKQANATALEKAKREAVRSLELVCLKNRGGACFTIPLAYKPQYEIFTDDPDKIKVWQPKQ